MYSAVTVSLVKWETRVNLIALKNQPELVLVKKHALQKQHADKKPKIIRELRGGGAFIEHNSFIFQIVNSYTPQRASFLSTKDPVRSKRPTII